MMTYLNLNNYAKYISEVQTFTLNVRYNSLKRVKQPKTQRSYDTVEKEGILNPLETFKDFFQLKVFSCRAFVFLGLLQV